jgi:hypothetical protein
MTNDPTDQTSASKPDASGGLLPSDHLTLLVEMMRPVGPDLGRRWLAALMLVPAAERAQVVASVEREIVAAYCRTADGGDGSRGG